MVSYSICPLISLSITPSRSIHTAAMDAFHSFLWQSSNALGKMLGKTEGRRRWLDGNTDSMDVNLSTLWETVKDREVWCATGHGVVTTR